MSEHFKHPHHDFILAWLEGRQLQFFDPETGWSDLEPLDEKYVSRGFLVPSFSAYQRYRLKEHNKFKCRVALFKRCDKYFTTTMDVGGAVSTLFSSYNAETSEGFVRWVTESIDVYIE
jgi:hypothetical protein